MLTFEIGCENVNIDVVDNRQCFSPKGFFAKREKVQGKAVLEIWSPVGGEPTHVCSMRTNRGMRSDTEITYCHWQISPPTLIIRGFEECCGALLRE
jgi:hypothetical protein